MEAKNIQSKKANKHGWHNNTHLCVNLKTQLRSDRSAKSGKGYQGILRRDVECDEFLYDEHFTFTEIVPQAPQKRNSRVYMGEHISVTRRDDGSLLLNFRPLKTDGHFSVERYALAVYNEICMALYGLVEEE